MCPIWCDKFAELKEIAIWTNLSFVSNEKGVRCCLVGTGLNQDAGLLYIGSFSHVIKFSCAHGLAVTAYTDKMVQIDTGLMRVYWFLFQVHVFWKGLLILQRHLSNISRPIQGNLFLVGAAHGDSIVCFFVFFFLLLSLLDMTICENLSWFWSTSRLYTGFFNSIIKVFHTLWSNYLLQLSN